MHAQALSHVQLFVTPRTVSCQVPLSMGFSRQEYWSGLPFPPPGDLPQPGIEQASPVSPALAGGILTTEPPLLDRKSLCLNDPEGQGLEPSGGWWNERSMASPDHLPRGIPKRDFISWVRADTKLFLGTSVSFSFQARRMLLVPQTPFYCFISFFFLLFLVALTSNSTPWS